MDPEAVYFGVTMSYLITGSHSFVETIHQPWFMNLGLTLYHDMIGCNHPQTSSNHSLLDRRSFKQNQWNDFNVYSNHLKSVSNFTKGQSTYRDHCLWHFRERLIELGHGEFWSGSICCVSHDPPLILAVVLSRIFLGLYFADAGLCKLILVPRNIRSTLAPLSLVAIDDTFWQLRCMCAPVHATCLMDWYDQTVPSRPTNDDEEFSGSHAQNAVRNNRWSLLKRRSTAIRCEEQRCKCCKAIYPPSLSCNTCNTCIIAPLCTILAGLVHHFRRIPLARAKLHDRSRGNKADSEPHAYSRLVCSNVFISGEGKMTMPSKVCKVLQLGQALSVPQWSCKLMIPSDGYMMLHVRFCRLNPCIYCSLFESPFSWLHAEVWHVESPENWWLHPHGDFRCWIHDVYMFVGCIIIFVS
jgi:hypothetical protein